MDPSILFDAQSTSIFSPLFNVVEGECVQLDAYSLCGGTAQVEKVLLSKPDLPFSGDNCACATPAVPLAQELASKTMCNWDLTDCASMRYICAVGTYRVRIQPAMLGCAFIVMDRMSRRDYPIPETLVLAA